ncbi:MAG: hypothetical protein KKE23_02340 [Nanoarchaeota archaeon]|nr:hypothetical protein [Nanoarchaeota archaeon]
MVMPEGMSPEEKKAIEERDRINNKVRKIAEQNKSKKDSGIKGMFQGFFKSTDLINPDNSEPEEQDDNSSDQSKIVIPEAESGPMENNYEIKTGHSETDENNTSKTGAAQNSAPPMEYGYKGIAKKIADRMEKLKSERDGANSNNSALNDKYLDGIKKNSELVEIVKRFEAEMAGLNRQLEEYSRNYGTINKKYEDALERIRKIDGACSGLEFKVKNYEQALANDQKIISDYTSQIEASKNYIKQLGGQLAEANSSFSQLKNIVEEQDGEENKSPEGESEND